MILISNVKNFLRSSCAIFFTVSILEWDNAHAMWDPEEGDLTRTQVIVSILLKAHEEEKRIDNNATNETNSSAISNKNSESDNDLEILKQGRLKHNTEVLADRPDASVDLFMQNAIEVLPKAQLAIGSLYCEEKKDYYEALRWFEKAKTNGCAEAEQGILLAQVRVAQKYYENQHFDEALTWFKKAAKGGANSQFNIGMLYVDEKIAHKNGKNAIRPHGAFPLSKTLHQK